MTFVLPFITSSFLCAVLVALNQRLGIGRDKSIGVQKFHINATSRLGGAAIMSGLICTLLLVSVNSTTSLLLVNLLLASIPVFFAGTLEDITHKITPSARLILALVSSTLAYSLFGVNVIRTDVYIVDWLLKWPVFVYLFTLLVIAGFTHAINIIDGFNGLASGQVLLMLGFLSYLNHNTNQLDLFFISTSLLFITLGFFVWNWPFGKIFLGDGGAYLLGFCVVCLGLLLVSRSSYVSPFAPIMLGLYPLVEALFSIYRRLFVRGHSITKPDAIHLHSLIFRRVLKGNLLSKSTPQFLNSKVATFFWFSSLIFGCLTCFFFNNTILLLVLFSLYIFLYVWLFIKIIRFQTPKWLSFFI